MRPVLLLLPLVQLAACAAEPAPVPAPTAPDLRARQEAACTATIAAHIRRPSAEVTSRWLSDAAGVATVEARDGNRLHLCQVDGSGRVLGYTHPGA